MTVISVILKDINEMWHLKENTTGYITHMPGHANTENELVDTENDAAESKRFCC
jgi:hypothetical protein